MSTTTKTWTADEERLAVRRILTLAGMETLAVVKAMRSGARTLPAIALAAYTTREDVQIELSALMGVGLVEVDMTGSPTLYTLDSGAIADTAAFVSSLGRGVVA